MHALAEAAAAPGASQEALQLAARQLWRAARQLGAPAPPAGLSESLPCGGSMGAHAAWRQQAAVPAAEFLHTWVLHADSSLALGPQVLAQALAAWLGLDALAPVLCRLVTRKLVGRCLLHLHCRGLVAYAAPSSDAAGPRWVKRWPPALLAAARVLLLAQRRGSPLSGDPGRRAIEVQLNPLAPLPQHLVLQIIAHAATPVERWLPRV